MQPNLFYSDERAAKLLDGGSSGISPLLFVSAKNLFQFGPLYAAGSAWLGLLNNNTGQIFLTKDLKAYEFGVVSLAHSFDTTYLYFSHQLFTTTVPATYAIRKIDLVGNFVDSFTFSRSPGYLSLYKIESISQNRILLWYRLFFNNTFQNLYYVAALNSQGQVYWDIPMISSTCWPTSHEYTRNKEIEIMLECNNDLYLERIDTLGNRLSHSLLYRQPSNYVINLSELKQAPDEGHYLLYGHLYSSTTSSTMQKMVKLDSQNRVVWEDSTLEDMQNFIVMQDGSVIGMINQSTSGPSAYQTKLIKWSANGQRLWTFQFQSSSVRRDFRYQGMLPTPEGDLILYGQGLGLGQSSQTMQFTRINNVGRVYDPTQPITSLPSTLSEKGLRVYPNPGQQGFFIEGDVRNKPVEILSTSGVLLGTFTPNESGFLSFPSQWPQGVYVIRIGSQHLRWVKD